MNLMFLQAGAQGSAWTMPLMMVLIFAVFWFFMIRPQQKKQKQLEEARNNMGKGDKVITSGGIYGVIKGVKDDYFIVEVAEGVRMNIARSSVYPAGEEPVANN